MRTCGIKLKKQMFALIQEMQKWFADANQFWWMYSALRFTNVFVFIAQVDFDWRTSATVQVTGIQRQKMFIQTKIDVRLSQVAWHFQPNFDPIQWGSCNEHKMFGLSNLRGQNTSVKCKSTAIFKVFEIDSMKHEHFSYAFHEFNVKITQNIDASKWPLQTQSVCLQYSSKGCIAHETFSDA